jgi:hypothetical protein
MSPLNKQSEHDHCKVTEYEQLLVFSDTSKIKQKHTLREVLDAFHDKCNPQQPIEFNYSEVHTAPVDRTIVIHGLVPPKFGKAQQLATQVVFVPCEGVLERYGIPQVLSALSGLLHEKRIEAETRGIGLFKAEINVVYATAKFNDELEDTRFKNKKKFSQGKGGKGRGRGNGAGAASNSNTHHRAFGAQGGQQAPSVGAMNFQLTSVGHPELSRFLNSYCKEDVEIELRPSTFAAVHSTESEPPPLMIKMIRTRAEVITANKETLARMDAQREHVHCFMGLPIQYQPPVFMTSRVMLIKPGKNKSPVRMDLLHEAWQGAGLKYLSPSSHQPDMSEGSGEMRYQMNMDSCYELIKNSIDGTNMLNPTACFMGSGHKKGAASNYVWMVIFETVEEHDKAYEIAAAMLVKGHCGKIEQYRHSTDKDYNEAEGKQHRPAYVVAALNRVKTKYFEKLKSQPAHHFARLAREEVTALVYSPEVPVAKAKSSKHTSKRASILQDESLIDDLFNEFESSSAASSKPAGMRSEKTKQPKLTGDEKKRKLTEWAAKDKQVQKERAKRFESRRENEVRVLSDSAKKRVKSLVDKEEELYLEYTREKNALEEERLAAILTKKRIEARRLQAEASKFGSQSPSPTPSAAPSPAHSNEGYEDSFSEQIRHNLGEGDPINLSFGLEQNGEEMGELEPFALNQSAIATSEMDEVEEGGGVTSTLATANKRGGEETINERRTKSKTGSPAGKSQIKSDKTIDTDPHTQHYGWKHPAILKYQSYLPSPRFSLHCPLFSYASPFDRWRGAIIKCQ